MPAGKKYDLSGKETGEVNLDLPFTAKSVHPSMLKEYVRAYLFNQRQWSACTRGRSEVSHSKKKPRPQKGSGRARQGFLGAPQFKGGGVVFGPKPKYHQRIDINRKERRAVFCSVLADKVDNNALCFIDTGEVEKPQTKLIAQFLHHIQQEKRVLFLCGKEDRAIQSSISNLPHAVYASSSMVCGYDLLLARHIVATESGWAELMDRLKGEKHNEK